MQLQLNFQQCFVVDIDKLILKFYGHKKAADYSKQPWRTSKSELLQIEKFHVKSQ